MAPSTPVMRLNHKEHDVIKCVLRDALDKVTNNRLNVNVCDTTEIYSVLDYLNGNSLCLETFGWKI